MSGTQESADKKTLTNAEKRARAKTRKAEREERRQAENEAWKAQVASHFDYLEATYGFHIACVEFTGWNTFVRYESSTLAIRVDRSVEFNRVEVWLIRLIDGQVPDYPVFVTRDTPINYIPLDRLLDERAPRVRAKSNALKGLSAEQVENSLAFWAHALRTYGDDMLRGDLAMFNRPRQGNY